MDSITFYGAASEVGRSCFLVESNENTMLDCGIKLEERKAIPPAFDVKRSPEVDQLLISHAHIDHCGYAPALYQHGFTGKTLLTKATRDMAQVLLADALRLQGESLFSKKSVDKFFAHTKLVEYRKPGQGVEFRDAGHVLGSAMILLDTGEHRILYTGDVCTRATRLLDGADLEELEADILITEGTYGGHQQVHPATKTTVNNFIRHVKTTLDHNGKVLVPTFATGRGQEVLLTLESFMRSGALPKCPIFLDGMVRKMMRIHRHNSHLLRREIQLRILTSNDDPFKSKFFREPKKKDKSDVLLEDQAIIVAPSGMLVGGPSVRYFQALAPYRRNKVILSGYQAEDTPGRKLQEGVRKLEVGKEMVDVKCDIEKAPFSGHADSQELLHLARRVKGLKQVFVVHGERQKSLELAKNMQRHLRVKAHVPELGEKVQL